MPSCSTQISPAQGSRDAGLAERPADDAGGGEVPTGSDCSLVVLMLTSGSDPCLYTSPQRPPVPDNVRVRIDDMTIAADATDGWHYGPDSQSIVFTGDTCDVVLKGAAAVKPPRSPVVVLLLGCPPGGPIP
jgi:hypothetical protein